jgi:HAD superfamily 5'-nucleotidase-like hydrolase
MKTSDHSPPQPPPARRIYCNRTLNLRSIRAIGFDMDYTLIHYRVEAWERSAYEKLRQRLADRGWPVEDLQFDPGFAVLGLIADLECGNLVKANRFGYVKQATHGMRRLEFEQQRKLYSRLLVHLSEPRWVFLNTLFSLSGACMYSQLVDLLDAGQLPGPMNYADLYRLVHTSLDEAHAVGDIKQEIVADPDRFVVRDEELPLALMDLKQAGNKLMLITNSEWDYTCQMMAYAFDGFLPGSQRWRDLFDLIIVQARKPAFFTGSNPIFEVVDAQGLLRPVVGALETAKAYLGGSAGLVEQHFGLSGEEILYVGDHIFADVQVSKNLLRWRTALVVRALEDEIAAVEGFGESQRQLTTLMNEKELLEHTQNSLRLALQRHETGRGPRPKNRPGALRSQLAALRSKLDALDARIAPLAKAHAELSNPRWGLLMRAGNDKSNLARQIERYADVYTSRVSNLLYATPFAFFRSGRTTLPHDSQACSEV